MPQSSLASVIGVVFGTMMEDHFILMVRMVFFSLLVTHVGGS